VLAALSAFIAVLFAIELLRTARQHGTRTRSSMVASA
jgi:hypothetical protein